MSKPKSIKAEILSLRAQGKNYNEIVQILKCSKGTVSYHCSEFGKSNARRRRMRLAGAGIRALKLKAGGKCISCGYNKYFGALDFHHVNGNGGFKNGVTRFMNCYGYKRAEEEARKCVLLCSNCHRELHGGVLKLDNIPQPFSVKGPIAG